MTNENQNTAPQRVEISKRLVMINSASSLVTRMLSISVLVWLQQYLLKRIEPAEYALLPVLYSVMMFAPLVTTILTAGLGRYIVEAYARHDDERVTQITSTMFPILCGAGLFFLAAGWTLAWHIGSVLDIEPEYLWDARVMMALLMFSAAIRLPVAPFGAGLFVRQKFVLQNLIQVGTEIFRLSLLLILLLGVSTRVLWVIMASVSAGFLGQIISVIISRRLVPTLRFRPSHIDWPIARQVTTFGGWSFVQTLANAIRMALDPIILNRFASPLDVASFHLGAMPLRHIQGFGDAARGTLAPSLTAMHAAGDLPRQQRVYLRGGRVNLWASLFLALPLMVYAHEFIGLYVGETYENASTVMQLSLMMFPIAYGNTMFVYLCQAQARVRLFAVRFLLMNCLNLCLTLVLVIGCRLGAIGSALATAASFAVVYPLLMWPAGRQLVGVEGRKWFRHTVLPGFAPGSLSLIVMLALKFTVFPDTWFELLACVAVGELVYVGTLLFGCLGPDDKADLNRLIHALPLGHRIAASRFGALMPLQGHRP